MDIINFLLDGRENLLLCEIPRLRVQVLGSSTVSTTNYCMMGATEHLTLDIWEFKMFPGSINAFISEQGLPLPWKPFAALIEPRVSCSWELS